MAVGPKSTEPSEDSKFPSGETASWWWAPWEGRREVRALKTRDGASHGAHWPVESGTKNLQPENLQPATWLAGWACSASEALPFPSNDSGTSARPRGAHVPLPFLAMVPPADHCRAGAVPNASEDLYHPLHRVGDDARHDVRSPRAPRGDRRRQAAVSWRRPPRRLAAVALAGAAQLAGVRLEVGPRAPRRFGPAKGQRERQVFGRLDSSAWW